MTQNSVTLRPVCASDEDFLFRVFKSVHEQTFAMVEMPEEQKHELLRMQFVAQREQYRQQFPNADFDLILYGGTKIGNLYALRGPERFVLIDIALLPEYRNKGVGTGKSLDAHVQKDNPAWRLWQRLGFEKAEDDGVYLRIRR
jgi:ribosomal protein S18 acetylase RimI-like enzyme